MAPNLKYWHLLDNYSECNRFKAPIYSIPLCHLHLYMYSFITTAPFISVSGSLSSSNFSRQITKSVVHLTLKAQTKIAADDILIFYFYLSRKIRLDF